GPDLFRSGDGGRNWGVASYWWFDAEKNPEYAHADHHVILFHPDFGKNGNTTLFVANDGGIFRTTNSHAAVGKQVANLCGDPPSGAVQWDALNNDYAVTQFYRGLPSPDGST